jgi:hypothetical protein
MLMQGRMLSEQETTSLLDEFQKKQPEIYQAIFGQLSDAIVEENRDMANLFLDLCFDIIWIYYKAFGKPPQIRKGEQRVLDSLSLLDPELKSLYEDIPMNEKLRLKLQERFVKRSVEAGVQMELLEILHTEVQKYASFKKERQSAISVTNNLLFVIVRLMDDLYGKKRS